MRSSRALRLPPGWDPPRRGLVLALALTTPFLVLFLLVIGLGGLLGGQWGVGGWAISTAVVIALGSYDLLRRHYVEKTSFDAVAIVATKGGAALRIRYSREVVVLRFAGLVLLGSGFTLLGMALWANGVILVSVVVAATGVGCLGWLVAWYVRGIRVGELVLSPDGIRLRVDHLDLAVTWDDLTAVLTAQRTDRYGIVTKRSLHLVASHVTGWAPPRPGLLGRLDPRSASPEIEVRCDMVDVDSAVLYWLLRFYHSYPLARPELGTQAAVDRMRDRMFLGG